MISVIIPNYNNAHYLKNAVQSVLNQTFTDYEIIVVDDGSTDKSKDVVSTFGDKVRYIWQENRGLGAARNTGILASNAEFIGLLDADDEWKPTYLEKMMSLVWHHSDATVYYCAARSMDAMGQDLPQVFGRMISKHTLHQTLLRANFIIPSTITARRHALLEIGLFEEKNRALHGCEDWDLWLRLSLSHKFAGTHEALVRYRLHPNTFSANPSHMQGAVRTVIEKNFGADDGKYKQWSEEKKWAFGGVYRYCALTSVHKQGNWEVATESLRKAFEIDPTLAVDLDLFYELAFGAQPTGYRETTYHLELEQNAKLVMNMLANIFGATEYPAHDLLRKKAFGTANYAIGLVAYNTNRRDLSKRYLFQALAFSPNLLRDRRVVLTLIKSYVHPSLVARFKQGVKGVNRSNYAG